MSESNRTIDIAELSVGVALMFNHLFQVLERAKLTDRSETLEALERAIRSCPEGENEFLSALVVSMRPKLPPMLEVVPGGKLVE